MTNPSKNKGSRVEREIVERHIAIHVEACRVPLSGAAGGHFGGDIWLWPPGYSQGMDPPLIAEVKARKSGAGFITLEGWLGALDILFLRRDRQEPMVVMPWATYAKLMEKAA